MDTKTEFLRPAEAAKYLTLAPSTLAKMRVRGDGPPYVKAGRRVVLYDLNTLKEWAKENTRQSTSEEA